MASIKDLFVSYLRVDLPLKTTISNNPFLIQSINFPSYSLENLISRAKQAVGTLASSLPTWGGWSSGGNLSTSSSNNRTTSTNNSGATKPAYTQYQGYEQFNLLLNTYLEKHPEDKDIAPILTEIAGHESNFKSDAKNPTSSASGYFLFLDSTRTQHSTKSKLEFLNDPQELIRTAAKLARSILNLYLTPKRKAAASKLGLSPTQVMYGYWFRPASMNRYLDSGSDNYRDPQGTTLQTILNKVKA